MTKWIKRLPLIGLFLLSHIGTQACSIADNREALARQYFDQKVSGQSGGAIALARFAKTNGFDQELAGTKMYVLEWSADLSIVKDIWKQGNAFVGYWSNFAVLAREPSTLENLALAGSTFFEEESAVRLTGTCQFRQTDNGWRVEECDVKASQVLPRQPQTLEGVVTGPDGTRYWRGYTMEAGGKEYRFVTEFNAGQGKNPSVEGGTCCENGMRIRVTYIPHKNQGNFDVTHILILR
ncbi:MAG: hypothetical protein NT151_13000 [Acidobacteria bacterium]|nr:hypothetical protein [Acidobacteriota bacterium]